MGGFYDILVRETERLFQSNYPYIRQRYHLDEVSMSEYHQVVKVKDAKSIIKLNSLEAHNQ
jgi:hypothetical protein